MQKILKLKYKRDNLTTNLTGQERLTKGHQFFKPKKICSGQIIQEYRNCKSYVIEKSIS